MWRPYHITILNLWHEQIYTAEINMGYNDEDDHTIYWGTGIIASSSTFRPHPGRVIRNLFRLLNAVYDIVRKH